MNFNIERTLKVGDILTSASVIISAIALIAAITNNSAGQQREEADRVRNAASSTLAKIERRQLLSLSAFEEVQPVLVATSEMLAKRFDVFEARDFLWKELNKSKARIHKQILDEQIETAYSSLYGYDPQIREIFRLTLARLHLHDEEMWQRLLAMTETDVLSFRGQSRGYQTAMLGNRLRSSVGRKRTDYSSILSCDMRLIEDFLADIVARSDAQLTSEKSKRDDSSWISRLKSAPECSSGSK